MSRRGLSLVELLIVIAIISILAGILMPVLAQARRAAQQRSCASNVRQLGLALRLYVDDFDGSYPIGAYLEGESRYLWNVTWHNELMGYLNDTRLLYCPLVPARDSYRASYGCNSWISRWNGAVVDAELGDTAQTVYAAEKEGPDWPAYPPSLKNLPHYRPLIPRHNGTLTLLYCDGHVRSLPFAQVEGPGAIWRF
jgi:prepilin-type N-terminal cleavage/methylation domain-containing protein/prepilin-type processing-associated H-X9-DG protein